MWTLVLQRKELKAQRAEIAKSNEHRRSQLFFEQRDIYESVLFEKIQAFRAIASTHFREHIAQSIEKSLRDENYMFEFDEAVIQTRDLKNAELWSVLRELKLICQSYSKIYRLYAHQAYAENCSALISEEISGFSPVVNCFWHAIKDDLGAGW